MGEFLDHDTALNAAVIVAEPDFHMETLPYYADNAIYMPRERRYGTTVSWSHNSDSLLSLSGLLNSARAIQKERAGPVLIVVGDPVRLAPGNEEIRYPFLRKFYWTHQEFVDFDTSTVLLRDFDRAYAYEENYRVYLLK